MRKAKFERKTKETEIEIEVNLDGEGKCELISPARFLNHMLSSLAKTSLIDLKLKAKGDYDIDDHHIVEDIGICLGEVLKKSLGEKKGIERYGYNIIPFDETVAKVAIDLSNRPYLIFKADFKREKIGDLSSELVEHFFYSVAYSLGANIFIEVEGRNDHHKTEAIFKGFGLALRKAIEVNPRIKSVLSTKEVL